MYETVSCMQQLRARYAFRTCYHARASLWLQPHVLDYAQLQATLSPLYIGYSCFLIRQGEQEYE